MDFLPDIWGSGSVFGYPESGDIGLHGRLCADGIGVDFDGSDRCSLRINIGDICDISPKAVFPEYVRMTVEGRTDAFDITIGAVSPQSVYIHCDRCADVDLTFGEDFSAEPCDGGKVYLCGSSRYSLIRRTCDGGVVYGFACGDDCEAEARKASGLSVKFVSEALLEPYKELNIPDSISDIYRPLYMRCAGIVRNGISSKHCFGKCVGGRFTIPVVGSIMRAVALKNMFPEYARATVLKVADHISGDGFLPADITESCCVSAAPPVICYGFDEILGDDKELVRKYYDSLRSCIMYFVEKRDINKDYTYQLSSGDKGDPGVECGMPNSPRFDSGVLQSSPDISGYMYLAALAMGNMSRTINRNSDIIYWGILAQRIATGANARLFDKSKCFYYDRPIIGSHFVDVRATSGFMPLFAGFVPEEAVSDIVAHLDDPTAFRTGRGIPTVAVGDAKYCQDMNRGSMSLFECYKILKGMMDAGFITKAQAIAGRCLDTVRRGYMDDGILYSHYSSDRAVSHHRQKLFGKSIMQPCRDNFEFVADCPETAAYVLAIANMMAEDKN